MGQQPSQEFSGIQDLSPSNCSIKKEFGMEDSHVINKSRWSDLMYSLQSIATLQRAATRAGIEARQKRREATFKREDVWIRDAKFMGEIQKLNAQGKLQAFEELSRLAVECQASRDLLGPLEQDCIEAESRWQGQIWKLKESEEDLYIEFEDEFRDAEEFVSTHGEETSALPSSKISSRSSSTSEAKDEFMNSEPATLPVISSDHTEVESSQPIEPMMYDDMQYFGDAAESDLDSGVGDIDVVIGRTPLPFHNHGPPKLLPQSEIYHELLMDFSTQRERVNKWLEYNILESRLESLSIYSVLKGLLALEDEKVPSNWASLVIAHWYLDEASIPVSKDLEKYEQGCEIMVESMPFNESTSEYIHDSRPAIIEPHFSTPTDIPVAKQINPFKSDGCEKANALNETGLVPPTPTLPSPPNSHPNSRSTSCDPRREGFKLGGNEVSEASSQCARCFQQRE